MKRSKFSKKAKKRTPLEIIKTKAWDAFSLYIRKVRDKDQCYTCTAKGTAMNAGHFWHGVLDFDEENIHCQCVTCNKWKSGNLAVYAINLIRDIGVDKFKELEIRHHRDKISGKKEIPYYQAIIDKYSKLTAEYKDALNNIDIDISI